MSKLLVIEDNPEVRENTQEILELAGYEVTTASNGKEGVKRATEDHPDLIICDIMMPELDGYGVLNILSKNPNTSAIPFIFLTAKSEKDDFRKGMSMGADDYITKPFDETDLLNAIQHRLKKNELLKQTFSKSSDGYSNLIEFTSSLEELKHLPENHKVKSFPKKEFIYLEGGFARTFFYVQKGQVKTIKTNKDGKELITGIYTQGQFFGYMSFFNENEYTDSAVALEESDITIIPKEDFFKLLQNNREVAYQFIKLLADNVEEKERDLLNIAYNTMRKRVAEGLVKFYEKSEVHDGGELSISRDDLANLIGTATETVIRTLGEFKQDGLITTSGRKIIINDINKLKFLKF
jgi:CRP/FNR family transcriptional regulator, polysaccharide utilization system transcription regulator